MINRRLAIGDKVRLPVVPFTTPLSGTVIYIHPKRRFFRVEFENVLGDLGGQYAEYVRVKVPARDCAVAVARAVRL